MEALLIILGFIALTLFIIGFWKEDLVLWFLTTLLWFVETYLFVAFAISVTLTNTYIPEAIGLLSIGIILVCIYKDFVILMEKLQNRPHRPTFSEQYEDDKRRNHQHIYNITRRRF